MDNFLTEVSQESMLQSEVYNLENDLDLRVNWGLAIFLEVNRGLDYSR